jgi:preprotein translocase subunit SecA
MSATPAHVPAPNATPSAPRPAVRDTPFLRPGTRLGLYPQRLLHADDRLERRLERLVMPLRRPDAARRREWPAFLRRLERYDRALKKLKESDFDEWFQALRKRLWREHLSLENVACALATVREVSQRELGMRQHDEQMIGGWIMLEGMLAEMATGEGKTLTATLSACTAALAGIPVHVVTVNDYLAKRDAESMAPVYRRFGLTVGTVTGGLATSQRRAAYAADVTYCTNKQLVFDYLRDRLTLGNHVDDLRLNLHTLCTGERREEKLLLRGLYFAIVDEADSIFVDEARTPLILAGPASDRGMSPHYERALWLATQLRRDADFRVNEMARRIVMTTQGARRLAGIADPFGGPWSNARKREALVEQALAAQHLYQRDRHYLVRDSRVEIIDEHTGRTMPDRSWEQGLHQMIEVKEGQPPSSQHEPLARLSFQSFFQRYLRLGGMSGTAQEVRGELRSVYGVHVVTVPRHKPSRLRAGGAYYFRRAADKWTAIARAIERERARGRPVLAGTRTVADSEQLSVLLQKAGVPHQVLNARQDAEEAAIVARAGEPGQVTIATNMAGRGTDIALPESVVARGGLHVILCEHNESRRIDRQLIGRCARQGDPGSYELFGSLEDDLVRLRLGKLAAWLARDKSPMVSVTLGKALTRIAQTLAEFQNRRARRVLLREDERRDERLAFSGRAE